MLQKVGETEYRQIYSKYGMIFMLGGLWAAFLLKKLWMEGKERYGKNIG
jgi:hypothetical protein